jgi:N utilization substance protein B
MTAPDATTPDRSTARAIAPSGRRADALSVRSGQHDIEEVVRTFWSANLPGSEGAPEAVRTFAEQLVRLTTANLEKIDPLIVETAEHWRLSRMAALDRIILRLAIGEFLDGSTPRNVVINEALELAKTFSGEESVKFVNGILDAVKRKMP